MQFIEEYYLAPDTKTFLLIMSKTWFVVPSCDFGPEGPIALGSIIANAAKPWDSLNYHTRTPPTLDHGLVEGPSTDIEGQCRKLKEKQGGVWFKFLQLVTFAFGSLEASTDDLMRYKFDKIRTFRFIPSTKYLKAAIASAPRARDVIENNNYKNSMYIITGIKIAENADIEYIQSQRQAYASQMTASSNSLGFELGPSISARNAGTEMTSVKGRKNVVVAFELGEIHYDEYGLSTMTSNEGTLLSDGRENLERGIRVLGLRDWKVTAGHFDDETFVEMDD